MRIEKRNLALTLLFYLISVLTITVINMSGQFKSGPCTPSLDIVCYFLLGPLILIFLIINGVSKFYFHKQTKYSFYIHLLALIIWTGILLIN